MSDTRFSRFLKENIFGILLFSIFTGVLGNYIYDYIKEKRLPNQNSEKHPSYKEKGEDFKKPDEVTKAPQAPIQHPNIPTPSKEVPQTSLPTIEQRKPQPSKKNPDSETKKTPQEIIDDIYYKPKFSASFYCINSPNYYRTIDRTVKTFSHVISNSEYIVYFLPTESPWFSPKKIGSVYKQSIKNGGKSKLFDLDRTIAFFSTSGDKIYSMIEGKSLFYVTTVKDGKTINFNTNLVKFPNKIVDNKDGSICAIAEFHTNKIHIYDLNNSKLINTLEGHGSYIISLNFSSDSRKLISVSDDGATKLWEIYSGKLLNDFSFGENVRGRYATISENMNTFFISDQISVSMLNTSDYKRFKILPRSEKLNLGWPNFIQTINNDKYLIVGYYQGRIDIFDLDSFELIKSIGCDKKCIISTHWNSNLQVSNDGKFLTLYSDYENAFKTWDIGNLR